MPQHLRQLFTFVLLALLWPTMTKADNTENMALYSVTMNGIDQLKIEMPIYDEDDYDGWIDKGYVYVTPEGSSKQTLLYYYAKEKSMSAKTVSAYLKKGVDGNMVLRRDQSYEPITISTSETKCDIPSVPGKEYFMLYITWTVPDKMRGKKLTISWSVHKKGNGPAGPAGESSGDISVNSSTWTFPALPDEVRPALMDPMLSYDPSHAGQMMLVYSMATNDIRSLTAHYKEVNGNQVTNKTMHLEPNMSGFVYLDVSKCYRDFTLHAKYVDTEKKLRSSKSDPITLPTLQQPVGLKSSVQADGSVVLTWGVSHSKWKDIADGDMWDVQRNTAGSLNGASEWTTIGQVEITKDTIYTCTDKTLINDYQGKPVYYRVRRASTAGWNWFTGFYAQTLVPFVFQLPAVTKATAKHAIWEENRHTVDFTYDFTGSQYDNKGRFILRTAQDWETLAQMVNSGQTVTDVVMAADIDLGDSQTKLGTQSNRFRTNFDGNGHTLTVHYSNTTDNYIAPFAYVGGTNPSIKNIHVTGSIYSETKFAGGLIGNSTCSGLSINNCRSSVDITCNMRGDVTTGGLISHVESGNITLKDCLFDGTFYGPTAHSFGGFIGWSESIPKITNCLFAPANLTIDSKFNSCRTFARVRSSLIIANSYYTTSIDGNTTYTADGKSYMILRNSDDWIKFLDEIETANGNKDVNAIMMNDFETVYSAGFRQNIPYRGIFNGNGHTLTVKIEGEDVSFIAPFARTKNATIKNLNVCGTVHGGIHSAGLVGSSEGTELVIDNCHISTDVTTTSTHAGGIIGHGHSVKNYIRNCLFDGSITADIFSTNSYFGAIMGWEDGGTSNVIQNNLENGTYNNVNHAGMNYISSGSAYGGTNSWNYHDWGECNKVGSMSADELVEKLGIQWTTFVNEATPKQTKIKADQGTDASEISFANLLTLLGSQWEASGNNLMPLMSVSTDAQHTTTVWDKQAKLVLKIDKSVDGEVRFTERRELSENERKTGMLNHELTTPCVDHDFSFLVEKGTSRLMPIDTLGTKVTKAETGEDARYEFNSNVKIKDLTAVTQQTSVVLKWTTTGTGDYFRITRRDKATSEEVVLEDNCVQTTYLDKTPRPQHVYIYMVEGVNNCEGEHVDTAMQEGWCEPTGMVRGYVRLRDGTALSGIKVKAEPMGETAGETVTTTTDATGFYEIKGLQYTGTGSYLITAESSGDEEAYTEYTANFDEDTNLVTNANLIQNTYYLLSGYVMFEGTSVPVIGAQFERDGVTMNNGSGKPIVTDSQGRFTISIPQGQHRVRVVKDGHVFGEYGYYRNEEGDSINNWQKSVYDYVFWDYTKITLQGRVVGGDVQGYKPLGQLASKNNLGDSLTIVIQLEGDNASWLVRDQLNASVTERHTDYRFGTEQKDSCHMDTYRHRLVIKPSPETGEYCVPMLPVKYKVTEIYAEGYPTLFQAGKVGETLDLSSYVNGQAITYSRIYHSTPTLTVKQLNMMGEEYLGIKTYTDMDNTGKSVNIELWDKTAGYSFGHPVFMAGSPIILMLSAVEEYYKNNNPKISAPDVVHLRSGEVHINNALIATNESETIELDTLGEGVYRFTPQNLTFTEENDLALKTLTMTLLYDSTYYDVLPMNGEPIRGYVMASKAKSQGRRAVANGGTYLIDILRDPPGSGSSAYIESGTKLNYTFSQNVKAQLGVKVNIGKSAGTMNMWNGIWSGYGFGSELGNTHSVKTTDLFGFSVVTTYYGSWQYGYTFETNERISTSSSSLYVGRDADVFIGMTQTAILEDGIAVRAVNEETYNLLTTHAGGTYTIDDIDFKVRQGTMKLLATGVDSKGEKVYLIRDEVLNLYSDLQSTFAHSQAYIVDELIPELFNIRNALLLPAGTDVETAKKIAEQKNHPMYISTVPDNHDYYGLKDYYTQVNPNDEYWGDSIAAINSQIRTWVDFLALNEKEKLEATDLVKRYEIDGRASVSYSETFGTSDTESRYWQLPFIGNGLGSLNIGGKTFGGGAQTSDVSTETYRDEDDETRTITMDFTLFNEGFNIKFTPIVSLDYNYNYGKTDSHTKKAGFSLNLSSKSNLVVDVYRARTDKAELDARVDSMKAHGYKDPQDYFFQYIGDNFIEYVKGNDNGYGEYGPLQFLSYVPDSPSRYRSFVYRTRGGATCQPYEDERRTKYYIPGQLLDAKTIEIDRLRIWADQASVSNVPYDEPARFTIHMANESEMPSMCTEVFTYMLSDIDNAKGAKIFVDGNPLPGEGHSVFIPAGKVVTKQVEIYPGADFDYDNVVIELYDPSDKKRVYDCSLSAHFVPVAGKVNISLPGDKWVVNTESQYDSEKQQYYMPVRIDGFDVNYRNFDHIELQYKLSTQGDKEWVNICSYYKDPELMSKATGECKKIEDDGHIMATFWGEADPIEQQYDLRAVNYCRYGNGFLTRSSNILTGIKDTRRPRLFGTPKPEDGILDIGDDIMLRFSEPIAGNYLRELNNFQVLGQTNSSNITLSTCLTFDKGNEAYTKSTRNLSGRSFTVDVMIKPSASEAHDMIFFSHGEIGNKLELGVTADRRLMARILSGDMYNVTVATYYSTSAVDFSVLHQVQYVIESNLEAKTTTFTFYDGSKQIGSITSKGIYTGQGRYHLGNRQPLLLLNDANEENTDYVGEMLEFRLWNRALSSGEMDAYKMKRLTGYELGLMDNFPLNEGKGQFSYNRVESGGDLQILKGTWKVPDGIAMKLDGEKGFRIDPQKFSRNDYHDYTLMFWFSTNDDNGTLLGNGLAQNETGAKNHFNIGVKNGDLMLNLGGQEVTTSTTVNNGQWHHVALSVSRSRNVGCLYLDHMLKNTFPVDTIGGIYGNYLAAGATYVDANTAVNAINGHIDEIAMYEMALSENLIKATSTMTPTGEEMGLLAYLNFARNELQMNNLQYLMPTGISLKRYTDKTTGQLTTQLDTLVAQDVVERLADKSNYAPMRGLATLENIKYSYVAKDNELYINLDVPDYAIEKTNVMVTVKDVADLNGNVMASPVTMDLYIYRNPLHWNVKQLSLTADYGEETTFTATIQNLSGRTKRFTIEGLPLWIVSSHYEGVVDALGELPVTFTISPYINIGDFDEIIYIVDEEGMTEPLPITLKVRGTKPDWAVDNDLLHSNISMSIIGQVKVDNIELAHDNDDMLAAFDTDHRLLGVTHLSADATGTANDGLVYLNVYNSNYAETPLTFEFFDASTGTIYMMLPDREMKFHSDTIIGTTTAPVSFTNNNGVVQTIPLKKGWNWISFNIEPISLPIKQLLNNATRWQVGDGLEADKADGSHYLISYKAIANPRDPKSVNYMWDYADSTVYFAPTLMYRLYSTNDKLAYIPGFHTFEEPITVKNGWNRVGYISDLNLPLGTALADYTDQGTPGDIIKGQNEFAILTQDATGNKLWKGTLNYMRVGEGYMIKHQGADITFTYPDYFSDSRYDSRSATLQAPVFQNVSGTSMTVVAVAEGVEVMAGDRLTAYRGAEVCGIAVADEQGVFYLNVGGVNNAKITDVRSQLTFTIERADEVMALTSKPQLVYQPDAALGSPDAPTIISFTAADAFESDGWYLLNGIKLDMRPTKAGVYIYNGRKKVVK